MTTSIKRALKNYQYDDIVNAIINYATVLESNQHYFTYKWTIDLFLKREGALPCFLNESDPLNNFLKKGKEKSQDMSVFDF